MAYWKGQRLTVNSLTAKTLTVYMKRASRDSIASFPAGTVLSSTKLDLLLNRKKRWSTASKDEISLP